jgi:hypothetical protein
MNDYEGFAPGMQLVSNRLKKKKRGANCPPAVCFALCIEYFFKVGYRNNRAY